MTPIVHMALAERPRLTPLPKTRQVGLRRMRPRKVTRLVTPRHRDRTRHIKDIMRPLRAAVLVLIPLPSPSLVVVLLLLPPIHHPAQTDKIVLEIRARTREFAQRRGKEGVAPARERPAASPPCAGEEVHGVDEAVVPAVPSVVVWIAVGIVGGV